MNKNTRIIVWVAILLVVVIVLIMNSGADNIDENSMSAPAQELKQSDKPGITSVTIESLLGMDINHAPTFVEIKTKIFKKITFKDSKTTPTSQKYLFEIGDSRAVAIFDVSRFPDLYLRFNEGDLVVVRGALGRFACESNTTDGDPGAIYLCKILGTKQIQIPWVVAPASGILTGGNSIEKITK